MSTFQVSGLVSGLNTDEIIQQLMAIERQPVVRLEQRQQELQEKADAWRDVRTRLTNLLSRVSGLRLSSTFLNKKVTSSDENTVTATAAADAAAATYEVKVLQLAMPQRNTSGEHSSIDDPLAVEGKLFINDTEITIDAADSVTAVMNKINSSESGVRASIVNNRLIITGEAVGSFTLADDQGNAILSKLKLLTEEGMEVREAQKAVVEIEGQTVESDTNTIEGIVPGLTINLKGPSPRDGEGNPIAATLTVSHDTDKALKAVQDFVDQYNSAIDFIASQLEYNVDTEQAGKLFAESTLVQIQSRLRLTVGSPVEGLDGDLTMLAQVGITTGEYGSTTGAQGKLEVDEAKFRAALEANPEAVAELFKAIGDILNEDLTAWTSSATGIISGREKAINDQIADLKKQVERWEVRLEMREEALVRQFTALERVLGQLNNQSAWLAGQINYIAAGWKWQQGE